MIIYFARGIYFDRVGFYPVGTWPPAAVDDEGAAAQITDGVDFFACSHSMRQ